ncbi:MAG TPA: NnrS family protein [Pseudomonas sp.]|jgi:uncharacterized protein involved in response to NO
MKQGTRIASSVPGAAEGPKSIAPLWRLGFRPFFLAGAAFAVVAIGVWVGMLQGWLAWQPSGGALAWHRHEMLFGFAAAIIAGFLLTAVQNWTGQPGLSGQPLIALFALWLAGRLAWFVGLPVSGLIAVQITFLPVLAVVLGRQLWRTRQKHNYPIVLILSLLTLCQMQVLMGVADGDDGLQRRGAIAGLWLVAALLGVIGARVIPMFTQRGLARPAPAPSRPVLGVLSMAGALVIAMLSLFGFNQTPEPWLVPLFLGLGCLYAVNLLRWYEPGIWKVPLLWSLHVAYAWLLITVLCMAAWHAGLALPASAGTHALAIGAMSGLILAMISRVSLGHTGRPLQVSAAMTWAFACLQLAAVARVLITAFSTTGIWLAALLWLMAFALFLTRYGQLLCSARADGQPG